MTNESPGEAVDRVGPEHEEAVRALLHLRTMVQKHRADCRTTSPLGCGTERRMLHALDLVLGLERELKASMLEAKEAMRDGN